jgi:hypothetical protein
MHRGDVTWFSLQLKYSAIYSWPAAAVVIRCHQVSSGFAYPARDNSSQTAAWRRQQIEV